MQPINVLHSHAHGNHHSLIIWCDCWQKQVRSESNWVTKHFTGELRLPTNTKFTYHQIYSSHAPLSLRITCCRAHSSITIIISTNLVTDLHTTTTPSTFLSTAMRRQSPYNANKTATNLSLKKYISANRTTVAVARFLLKPSLIARIGFLLKLLTAVVMGLNVVFTKELLKPQAACLQQQVFIFCAQMRLCVHAPTPLAFKQMNPTRPSYFSGRQSNQVGYPAFCWCALHPFAENCLTASNASALEKSYSLCM